MTKIFLLISALLLNLKTISQISCDSIGYNNDSLAVTGDKLFTGHCIYGTKKIAKNYFSDGKLDSIHFLDKKGRIRTVETYACEYSTFSAFYKNGLLKQSIHFKEDKYFGFWREYYKNGKIKYEAEYTDNEHLKDDAHYSWDKKGNKYLHACFNRARSKKIDKFQIDSNYGNCKKVKVVDGMPKK
jgi:hypothetical protein